MRLTAFVPTMVVVSIVLFIAINIVPGSAARSALGIDATPQAIERFNAAQGLDKPLPVQYYNWLTDIAHGDFGTSFQSQQSVGPELAKRLPITVELALLAFAIANLIAIPLGVLAASAHQRKGDSIITFFASLIGGIPNFWLATLLIMLFAVEFHILPAGGYVPFTHDPIQNLKSMIMPAISLGLVSAALLLRIMRAGMIDVLSSPYIQTAKAKGASTRVVLRRHALLNALTPYLTVGAVEFGFLFGSVVIIEDIFSIPGVGSFLLVGVVNRDYPVLMASALSITFVALTGNMIVDIIGSMIDPRQVHRRALT
jgi:peptide/nickel transport system permease protein